MPDNQSTHSVSIYNTSEMGEASTQTGIWVAQGQAPLRVHMAQPESVCPLLSGHCPYPVRHQRQPHVQVLFSQVGGSSGAVVMLALSFDVKPK